MMTFTIPIYLEEESHGGVGGAVFTVRPLFYKGPEARAKKLAAALDKLRSLLHEHLRMLAVEKRQDTLAAWSYGGELREKRLKLRLELKEKSTSASFFFIGLPGLERELWHTPQQPALWFEVMPGQQFEARATEVLTAHLRELEREGESFNIEAHSLAPRAKARLTVMELRFEVSYSLEGQKKAERASLFGSNEKLNGKQELERVGRRLDSLYPDDLTRTVKREALVEDLVARLTKPTRRAVLITGPRMVGKSALLQEAVWQVTHALRQRELERTLDEDGATTSAAADGKRKHGSEVWLISPMRLISGMSYVGQWQSRVLAILEYAEKEGIILCFDDLLGLLEAGKSSSSDLNVAQVLKPWLEQRRVRLVAESTPEVLRVLRERDRALAEAFELLPVNEPSESETMEVLIHIAREMERLHECQVDVEALVAVRDVQRRFVRDAVFPGKGAVFLQRLAVKHARSSIGRKQVLAEFQERSGIAISMLDDRQAVTREHILVMLSRQVVGQNHAMEAFADVLVRLSARLNDTARPLATLLLLGPTGVGKTEAAKSLARFLFGDEARLLRFDMNEMTDATAVTRLAGSPQHPDGLLTNAIRRQPFAVVLFDEIEKASPEVFDMLLAVLDEGRLTDSLGRVADFTSAVVLLTSNLGARASQQRLGFRVGSAAAAVDDQTYISAAEQFFRPEFFNRLDAVLPFRDLGEDDLHGIAQGMIERLVSRDGLRQRSCFVRIGPSAVTRLAALGHHPQLGARALKRVLEREIAEPVALRLTSLNNVEPLRLSIEATPGSEGFSTQVQPVRLVPRTVVWPGRLSADEALSREVLTLCQEVLDRLLAVIDDASPDGPVELTALTPEQARYYQWREQWQRVEDMREAAEESLSKPVKPVAKAVTLPTHLPNMPTRKVMPHSHREVGLRHDRQLEAEQWRTELNEAFHAQLPEMPETPLVELVRELALLELIVTAADEVDERWLCFTGTKRLDDLDHQVSAAFHRLCHEMLGAEAAVWVVEKQALRLTHPVAQRFAELVTGWYWGDYPSDADALTYAELCSTPGEGKPPAQGPVEVVFRVHSRVGEDNYETHITDLRSGVMMRGKRDPAGLRLLLLTALPLPTELEPLLAPAAGEALETLELKRPKEQKKSRDYDQLFGVASDEDIPF